MPLGLVHGGGFTAHYDEIGTGARTMVAGIERHGIPIPGRISLIAHFKATLPSGPRKLAAVRKGEGRAT